MAQADATLDACTFREKLRCADGLPLEAFKVF
jgi:hypothetical protein